MQVSATRLITCGIGLVAAIPVLCWVGEATGLIGTDGCRRLFIQLINWLTAQPWLTVLGPLASITAVYYARRGFLLQREQKAQALKNEIQPVYGATLDYLKQVMFDRMPDAYRTHEKATQAWWKLVLENRPSMSDTTYQFLEKIYDDTARLDCVRPDPVGFAHEEHEKEEHEKLKAKKTAILKRLTKTRDALVQDPATRTYPL